MTDDRNHGELIRDLIRFKIDEEDEVRAEKGTMVLSLYVMCIKESEISHPYSSRPTVQIPFNLSSVLENNPIFNFLTTHELSFFVKRKPYIQLLNQPTNPPPPPPPPFFFGQYEVLIRTRLRLEVRALLLNLSLWRLEDVQLVYLPPKQNQSPP